MELKYMPQKSGVWQTTHNCLPSSCSECSPFLSLFCAVLVSLDGFGSLDQKVVVIEETRRYNQHAHLLPRGVHLHTVGRPSLCWGLTGKHPTFLIESAFCSQFMNNIQAPKTPPFVPLLYVLNPCLLASAVVGIHWFI